MTAREYDLIPLSRVWHAVPALAEYGREESA